MADWAAMVESRDAEISRLTAELKNAKADAEYFEEWTTRNGRRLNEVTAELATAKRDADLGWSHAEAADKDATEWGELCGKMLRHELGPRDSVNWLFSLALERGKQLRRYRLAWLSARRRSGTEAQYATEALELRDAEIVRLKAEQRTIFGMQSGECPRHDYVQHAGNPWPCWCAHIRKSTCASLEPAGEEEGGDTVWTLTIANPERVQR